MWTTVSDRYGPHGGHGGGGGGGDGGDACCALTMSDGDGCRHGYVDDASWSGKSGA